MSKRAEMAAQYLKTEQWGKKENAQQEAERRSNWKISKIINKRTEEYRTCEIEIWEIKAIIRKLKRRKAPGPDEVPTEVFKEMGEEGLEEIRGILNDWWKEEDIPEEQLRARVVLIYKKGDTSKYENYRQISLLNIIYKLYAAIVQRRIAIKLDKHIQKTQYGFRRKRGTADAIQLVRRIAEYGGKNNKPTDNGTLRLGKSIRQSGQRRNVPSDG